MKKLFALTLAVAMVLSMASVAFASDRYELAVEEDDLFFVSDGIAYYLDGQYTVSEEKYEAVYGDTLYMVVKPSIEGKSKNVSLSDINKNFKIKAQWSQNGKLVEGVRFEKIYADIYDYDNGEKELAFVIAIDTKSMPKETEESDVIGTITIDPRSKNIVDNAYAAEPIYAEAREGEEYKFDVAFTLNVLKADGEEYIDGKNPDIYETADNNYVYDFDEYEDEEHEIELYAGMGRFIVNTKGQGKIVINTDVEYNEGIEGIAPDANYVYFNSNNATFNRLGDLYLTANETDIVYKVNNDGTLTKLNPKYDDYEEAFVIRTRVIGNYIIAEEELPEITYEEPAAPVAPVVPTNPSTGAAC